MFSPQDIDVFIMTHNRASYLKSSVNSLLGQSVKGFSLTILDNASTDDTKAVAESFAAAGVKYVQTPQEEGIGANFSAAQRLACAKYVMIFHDDDLLHPQYIENVIKALNKLGPVNLLLSSCTLFNDGDNVSFPQILKNTAYLFESSAELAAYMYRYGGVSYASAVYLTEVFKKINPSLEKYGKNNDWPILIEAAQNSKVIFLNDKHCLFARLHKGQDTQSEKSGITVEQLLNWQQLYYDKCCSAFPDSNYCRVYTSRVYHDIKSKYEGWVDSKEKLRYSLDTVFASAHTKGLLSPMAVKCGRRRSSVYFRIRTFLYRSFKKYAPKEVKF